ncbi:MAG: hypothetical protein ABI627_02200 [Polyangiaceae bacterium]
MAVAGVLALALSGACGRDGRGAGSPSANTEPRLSPSEKGVARAEAAARRALNAAAEHARLTKAVADKLADGGVRRQHPQLLLLVPDPEQDELSVTHSVIDAERAAAQARFLLGFEHKDDGYPNRETDNIAPQADQAELDVAEVEQRNEQLAKALARIEEAAPSPSALASGLKSCANGTVVCGGPTPFCCRFVGADFQPDGRGECVADYGHCNTTEFACTSEHPDCPTTQGIVPVACEDDDDSRGETLAANGAPVFTCAPGRACHCKFQILPGEGRVEAEEKWSEEYNQSLSCKDIPDCEHFCSRDLKASPKLLSSACARLTDAAEKLVNGSDGPAGVVRGVALAAKECDAPLLPAGGARPAQAKACEMAAWGYNSSRDVNRNLALAARYYQRAYQLSGDVRDFRGAFEMTCAAETWSPGRREFDMDEWCNHGVPRRHWAMLAYSPEDPTRRFENDECSEALRNVGCTGVNVGRRAGIKLPEGQELKSAYCCRGERP